MKIHFIKFLCVCVTILTTYQLSGQTCSGSPCSVTPDYTVGSNISANAARLSTSGLPATHTNEIILVCGNFIIDADMVSFSSTFIIMEDALITVEDGNSFTLSEGNVYGCDGMWQSITIEGGASMHINHASIYDAYNAAVEAESGSNVLVRNSTFDRNHIGILVEGPNTGILSSNCIFLANAYNFSVPAGVNVNNGSTPWIGIDLHNSSMFMGSRTRPLSKNKFDGPFEFGIRSDNSTIMVEYSEFIDQASDPGGVWQGTAISTQNKSMATISNNSFENSLRGVESNNYNSSFTVKNNTFSEYTNAVIGNFIGSAFASVKNNAIGTSTLSGPFAIQLYQSGARLNAEDNIIYVDSKDGQVTSSIDATGIHFSGPRSGSATIIGNDLSLIYSNELGRGNRAGIVLNGCGGTETFGNNIAIVSEGVPFHGIRLRSSHLSRIEDNRIVADQQGSNIGIQVFSSENVKYCCNIDSLMSTAVDFWGVSDGSDFGSNELFESATGVLLWDGAIIGPQDLTGNRWNGNFTTIGARNWNNNNMLFRASLFVVNQIAKTKGPGSVDPTINWFEVDNSSDDTPCGSLLSTDCGEGPGMTPGLTPLDTLFAEGAMDTLLGDGDLWTQAQSLYSMMTENSSLYGVYDVTDDWYDDQDGDIVEDYYLVRDSINRLFLTDSLQQDTIDRAQDSISFYFSELRYLDSLIFADTVTNWYLYDSLQSLKVQKVDSFYSIYINTLENSIDDRVARAQTLLSTNDNLSTTDLPTRYEQMFNEIFLETVASDVDTFSQAQIDSLYAMASACPSDGGRAVYWAGALYQVIEPHDFDIQDQCTPASSIISGTAEKPSEPDGKLIVNPNPANNYIELSAQSHEFIELIERASIYNLSGAEVWNGMPDVNNRINIDRLPAGVYVLLIWTSDNQMVRRKFIIQR